MFDRIKKKTLSEVIMGQIADKIISGELKEGQKLPSERDMSSQMGVTRNIVREALRALSLIGLVIIKPGDGAFVASSDIKIPESTIIWMYRQQLQDIDDIYEARKLIESAVIKSTFETITDQQIDTLEELMNTLEMYDSEKSSVEKYNHLIEEYDLYLGQINKNKIYGKLMQTIILLRSESSIKSLTVPGSIENSIKQRKKITLAFKLRDSKKLSQALQDFYLTSRKFHSKLMN